MGIERFFTTTFTVLRDVFTGSGASQNSSQSTIGTFKGQIQQADDELTENLGLAFTETYTIWCAVDTDVEEGDTLQSGNNSYSIRAINKRTYVTGRPQNQHLELVVELNKDYASV